MNAPGERRHCSAAQSALVFVLAAGVCLCAGIAAWRSGRADLDALAALSHAFDVVHREDRVEMAAGPLTIAGRVDRVDRLASGALAVIDYKSGSPRVAGWIGDRPDDPQLPLYALAMGDAVAAVAFARLKAGEFGFSGLAREEGLIPGVPSVEGHRGVARVAGSWEELLAQWRASTDDLATRFARGESAVDPKRGLASCRHCELHPLCRVHERLGALAPDEGPGTPEDEE